MSFEEVLDQAMAMLQRRGRVTYRTLQRQFQLDEDALNDLKDELLYAHPEVRDDAGRGLVWSGAPDTALPVAPPPTSPQERAPLAYTPAYLAEQILAARSTLEGERKQVTVLFADLKGSTELIADLDPEAAQQLLDPALHRMMDAVHRYEGTVNQVLGDGIMPCSEHRWPMKTTPCGPVTQRWRCRPLCANTLRRCAVLRGWSCRCASGSTPGTWWCAPLAMICTWTTPPWGRPRTWRRAWNNWPPRARSG
jgi:hypothetical protein